jgi:hypothetical protein
LVGQPVRENPAHPWYAPQSFGTQMSKASGVAPLTAGAHTVFGPALGQSIAVEHRS